MSRECECVAGSLFAKKRMPFAEHKYAKLAKGYYGRAKNCNRIRRRAVEKGLLYAYDHRRQRKREMRSLWTQQVNAASREHGIKLSSLVRHLREAGVALNRKMLAELAQSEPKSFGAVLQTAQSSTPITSSTSASGPEELHQTLQSRQREHGFAASNA